MVNEERVVKMSRMAMFEKGYKKKCLKISSYYKKDYILLQTVMTLLWGTLGYLIMLAGYLALEIEELAYELSVDLLKEMGILYGGMYCIILILLGGIAVFYYGMKYQKSLNVSREYYKSLGELSAEYRRGK